MFQTTNQVSSAHLGYMISIGELDQIMQTVINCQWELLLNIHRCDLPWNRQVKTYQIPGTELNIGINAGNYYDLWKVESYFLASDCSKVQYSTV